MKRALLLLPILAACAVELPPIEGTISEAARTAPPPVLVPVGPILAERQVPVRARAAEAELSVRGSGLRRAADRLEAPGGAALDAAGADLRRRAEALRAAPL